LVFPSNFELSEARARSVAGMLKPSLSNPKRLVPKGKGEGDPVAPNDVEANKSKNRRVEISIPRNDDRGC
jgi:type VI secretion system protein ImpK